MLVLTRKVGESFKIGDDITIKVVESRDRKMRIGIEAPPDVTVTRTELLETKEEKKGGEQIQT